MLMAHDESTHEPRRVISDSAGRLLVALAGSAGAAAIQAAGASFAATVLGMVTNAAGYVWDDANGLWKRSLADATGQQQMAGYTPGTTSNRAEEIDPLPSKKLLDDLVDTTDISAATHYYPSATGGIMDGFTDYSLTGKLIDADGTLTLTLEVSNDETAAGADWVPVYFYDDELNVLALQKTVTNGTELLALSLNNNNFRLYRWVVVASGATNTVILKGRKKF